MKNIEIIKLVSNDKFGFIISEFKFWFQLNLSLNNHFKFLYYYKFIICLVFIIIKIIGC
jgi:hypothetical protein